MSRHPSISPCFIFQFSLEWFVNWTVVLPFSDKCSMIVCTSWSSLADLSLATDATPDFGKKSLCNHAL